MQLKYKFKNINSNQRQNQLQGITHSYQCTMMIANMPTEGKEDESTMNIVLFACNLKINSIFCTFGKEKNRFFLKYFLQYGLNLIIFYKSLSSLPSIVNVLNMFTFNTFRIEDFLWV